MRSCLVVTYKSFKVMIFAAVIMLFVFSRDAKAADNARIESGNNFEDNILIVEAKRNIEIKDGEKEKIIAAVKVSEKEREERLELKETEKELEEYAASRVERGREPVRTCISDGGCMSAVSSNRNLKKFYARPLFIGNHAEDSPGFGMDYGLNFAIKLYERFYYRERETYGDNSVFGKYSDIRFPPAFIYIPSNHQYKIKTHCDGFLFIIRGSVISKIRSILQRDYRSEFNIFNKLSENMYKPGNFPLACAGGGGLYMFEKSNISGVFL